MPDLGLTVIPCPDCTLRPTGFNVGDHIGEFLVNHGTLVDDKGRTVGHYAAHLLRHHRGHRGRPRGTADYHPVTAQGVEESSAEGGTIAITGGTGRYVGAKGEMRFHDTSETTTDITLILR